MCATTFAAAGTSVEANWLTVKLSQCSNNVAGRKNPAEATAPEAAQRSSARPTEELERRSPTR